MRSPARRAAKRIPVPVAESQLRLKMAGSGVGAATTGGTRSTTLCRPVTGILMVVFASIHAEKRGRPQTKTTTLKTNQGSQALKMVEAVWPWAWRAWPVMSSRLTLSVRLGCQKRRKTTRTTMVAEAATMATSQGPLQKAMRS